MIGEGDGAPRFELPAVVDGEVGTVALEDYLGSGVVILAFYPGDFNPACGDGTTGLGELDPFTMQADVTILGLSADGVYSHRAFAAEYDLSIPLLSDLDGSVAAEYGVAVGDAAAGRLTERAVFVVGPEGEIEYAWSAGTPQELPDVDGIRRAVESAGGTDTALARYRIGHAHYGEARRAFTRAMSEFGDREWVLAQGDFGGAREEFDEAADHFAAAARFGAGGRRDHYERAETKARVLERAAGWLADAASAYGSGEGAEAESLRSDAERQLERARDIDDPPEPGALGAGVDAGRPAPAGDATGARPDPEPAAEAEPEPEPDPPDDETAGSSPDADGESSIDEAELAAITAELEAQTAKTGGGQVDPEPIDEDDGGPDAETPDDDADERGGEDGDDRDVELHLTDPNEESDDERDGEST